jgi:hypothetical protein
MLTNLGKTKNPIFYTNGDHQQGQVQTIVHVLFYQVVANDTRKNGEWVCNKCGKTKVKSGG